MSTTAADLESAQGLAEYSALRAEIVTRLRIRHQILSFAVIALGLVLTLSVQEGISPTMPLMYPLLAACLALGWAQNDVRIGEIGRFIAVDLEPRLPGLTWEGHLHEKRAASSAARKFTPFVRFSEAYSAGIFVGSQVLVVSVVLPRVKFETLDWVLVGLDLGALIATLVAVRLRSSRFSKGLGASNVPHK